MKNTSPIMRTRFLRCRSASRPTKGARKRRDRANPEKIAPISNPVAPIVWAYRGKMGEMIPMLIMTTIAAMSRHIKTLDFTGCIAGLPRPGHMEAGYMV